ncbi:MAG: molybdopterin converting factor subunit 1 [bacterium]
MKIKLRFFAQLRDLVHCEETEIEIKNGATVEHLVNILGERYPNLREPLKTVSFGVNNEYASKDTILKHGDEVALLPPISGG